MKLAISKFPSKIVQVPCTSSRERYHCEQLESNNRNHPFPCNFANYFPDIFPQGPEIVFSKERSRKNIEKEMFLEFHIDVDNKRTSCIGIVFTCVGRHSRSTGATPNNKVNGYKSSIDFPTRFPKKSFYTVSNVYLILFKLLTNIFNHKVLQTLSCF